jgi:hypothetical protein
MTRIEPKSDPTQPIDIPSFMLIKLFKITKIHTKQNLMD